jgi:hypothetical protein
MPCPLMHSKTHHFCFFQHAYIACGCQSWKYIDVMIHTCHHTYMSSYMHVMMHTCHGTLTHRDMRNINSISIHSAHVMCLSRAIKRHVIVFECLMQCSMSESSMYAVSCVHCGVFFPKNNILGVTYFIYICVFLCVRAAFFCVD